MLDQQNIPIMKSPPKGKRVQTTHKNLDEFGNHFLFPSNVPLDMQNYLNTSDIYPANRQIPHQNDNPRSLMMHSNQMKADPNLFSYETSQQNIDRNNYNAGHLRMQQNQNQQNHPHPNNNLFGPGTVSDRDTVNPGIYYNRQFINPQGYQNIMPHYANNPFYGIQANSSFGSSNVEKGSKTTTHFNNSREEQDESSGHTVGSNDPRYETQSLKRPATIQPDDYLATDIKKEPKNIKILNNHIAPQSKKQSSGRPRKLVQSTKLEEPDNKSSNAPKTREPLTEGEKKANHVFSEQRRRELIRKGFNLLCEINPGLSSLAMGNSSQSSLQYSKSAILEKSAEYIVQLQTQVQHLEDICQNHGLQRIGRLQGQHGKGIVVQQTADMQNLEGSRGHLDH
jgi:hypothetical protein